MEELLVDINKAALTFLVPLTLEETYEQIVKASLSLLEADAGVITLQQDGELQQVYASAEMLQGVQPRRRGYTYECMTKQKVLLLHEEDFRDSHPAIVRSGIKAVLFIPLSYKNKSIGVLIIQSYTRTKFKTEHEEVLKLLGSMASLAIQQAKLHHEHKKALELRDFFIALAAQELRTPLTTINGYVSLLKSKLLKKETAEAKWVTQLATEMERLTHLVHDLLEINRIKAGKITYAFGPCNMNDLLERARNNFKFAFPNRIITYVNESPGELLVIGDFDKLLQVVIDILENAAKFSPSDTSLALKLSQTANHVIITIEDKGKGIDKSDLPYIFQGFYKPEYNQEHGMGVGLFMAKNIIEHHKGTITIKSQKKLGTIVSIKLPKIKM